MSCYTGNSKLHAVFQELIINKKVNINTGAKQFVFHIAIILYFFNGKFLFHEWSEIL